MARLPPALTLAIKATITLAGVGFLAFTTDLGEVARSLAGVAPLWPAAALALVVASVFFSAWRWQRLLRCDGVQLGRLELLFIYLESTFFGLFLPSAVGGDLFRGWRVHTVAGGARRTAVNLAVERIVGVTSLGCLGLLAVALQPELETDTYSALVIASVGAIATTAVLLSPGTGRFFAAVAARLRLARISTVLERIADQIEGYRRQRSLLPAVLALSAMQHLVVAAGLMCAGLALELDLGFEIYLAAVPILSLVSLLPSIGGTGPREVSVAYVLESAGAPAGDAVAVATILLAALIARGLFGGLVYLARRPSITRR
jgi:hypothetical protein